MPNAESFFDRARVTASIARDDKQIAIAAKPPKKRRSPISWEKKETPAGT
jgi:hypothetical protein